MTTPSSREARARALAAKKRAKALIERVVVECLGPLDPADEDGVRAAMLDLFLAFGEAERTAALEELDDIHHDR